MQRGKKLFPLVQKCFKNALKRQSYKPYKRSGIFYGSTCRKRDDLIKQKAPPRLQLAKSASRRLLINTYVRTPGIHWSLRSVLLVSLVQWTQSIPAECHQRLPRRQRWNVVCDNLERGPDGRVRGVGGQCELFPVDWLYFHRIFQISRCCHISNSLFSVKYRKLWQSEYSMLFSDIISKHMWQIQYTE